MLTPHLATRFDRRDRRPRFAGNTTCSFFPTLNRERKRDGPKQTVPSIRGLTMDENGATYLCDLVDSGEHEPLIDQSLPMYLIMVNGGIPGAMLRVSASGVRLGRSADNTFQLREITISRHHASLAFDPQGVARLTDLRS